MIHRFVDQVVSAFVVPFLVDHFDPITDDFSYRDLWGVPVGGGSAVQLVTYADGSGTVALGPDPNPVDGRIVYAQRAAGDYTLRVVGSDGTGDTQIVDVSSTIVYPQWNRQGTKILYRNGTSDLRVCDADGSNDGVVASVANLIPSFSWSRDGTEIVFVQSSSPSVIKRMNADGTGLTTVVTKADLFQVQWGYASDFIVYFTTFAAGEAFIANPDGTGETALTSFGTNAKSASRRFLADDDSAVYPDHQTSGPGAWQIYEAPTNAGGMVATGVWTTGNANVAPGRPHCYVIAPGRYYVCAYTGDFGTHGNLDFVSYALNSTDRRIEVAAYSETNGGSPFLLSLGDEAS